jgi:hypothetical protein
VTLRNDGDLPLTITGVDAPAAPFSLLDAPAADTVLAPDASVALRVGFSATTLGAASGSLVVRSSGGDVTVPLAARAVTSGVLEVDAPAFGDVTIGGSADATVTLRNAGATALRVLDSTPPVDGPLTVLDDVPADTTLAPGATRAVRVRFAPVAVGDAAADWVLATTADAAPRRIALAGRGVAAPVVPPVLDPPVVVLPEPDPPVTAPPVVTPPTSDAPPRRPAKAGAGLAVLRMRLSRDGRKVTVSLRISTRATGTLRLALTTDVKRRSKAIISRKSVRLARRGAYAVTFRLPSAASRTGWRRIVVDARYGGSAAVSAAAARHALVPAAGR